MGARLGVWREAAAVRLAAAARDNAAARDFSARLIGYARVRSDTGGGNPAVAKTLTRVLALLKSSPRSRGSELQISLQLRGGGTAAIAGGDAARPLDDFIEPLPGLVRMKRASIRVGGRYRTLEELVALIETVQREAVAMRGFRVERNTFELTFDVYGV